jgi:hypothetical protein
MKKRSGIAAIILSLSLVGSAFAGLDNWLLGAIAVTNAGPYVGAALNTATNMANLYLNYRNGQKIDAVGQQVQTVGEKVDQVDMKVDTLGKRQDHTNQLMSAFYQDTKIGFRNVNDQLAHNAQQLNVVHRDLKNLSIEQQANMAILTEQNIQINNKLDLMSDGISGVHERVGNLEQRVTTDMKDLKIQNTEIQSSLQTVNTRMDEFAQFAQTGMGQLASIQNMLEKLVGKDNQSTITNNNNG